MRVGCNGHDVTSGLPDDVTMIKVTLTMGMDRHHWWVMWWCHRTRLHIWVTNWHYHDNNDLGSGTQMYGVGFVATQHCPNHTSQVHTGCIEELNLSTIDWHFTLTSKLPCLCCTTDKKHTQLTDYKEWPISATPHIVIKVFSLTYLFFFFYYFSTGG